VRSVPDEERSCLGTNESPGFRHQELEQRLEIALAGERDADLRDVSDQLPRGDCKRHRAGAIAMAMPDQNVTKCEEISAKLAIGGEDRAPGCGKTSCGR